MQALGRQAAGTQGGAARTHGQSHARASRHRSCASATRRAISRRRPRIRLERRSEVICSGAATGTARVSRALCGRAAVAKSGRDACGPRRALVVSRPLVNSDRVHLPPAKIRSPPRNIRLAEVRRRPHIWPEIRKRSQRGLSSERTFDYVIVGAGSAGSTLANRLTRGRQAQRPRARIRRLRPLDLHPDAGGALDPAQHESLQLGLLERAGAASQQPPHLLPARQGARRLVLDQRPRLCARPRARLRPLGGGGRARLVLREGAPLLPPRREFSRAPPANIAAPTARSS